MRFLMRPLRVRFSLRWMMAAVAAVAMVVAAGEGLRRRRESFELRAEIFAQKVSDEIVAEQNYRSNHRSDNMGYDPRTSAAHYQFVDHYDALRGKYNRAAARPWLSVAPDPPEPAWPKGVPHEYPLSRLR